MEELCRKLVEVGRVSDRMMAVVLVFEDVLRLTSLYAQQSRSMEEKYSFYNELKNMWNIHSLNDFIVC